MKTAKILATVLIVLLSAYSLFGAPRLVLSTDRGPEFQIGDTFEVKVSLDGNENDGAYGVFFDLRYDNTVFDLINVENGGLLPEIPDVSETMTAIAPYNQVGRALFSSSLVGDRQLFCDNGVVAKLVFKALRAIDATVIALDPGVTSVYVSQMQKKTATIVNLIGLKVRGPYTNFFIQLVTPYNNYKSNVSKIDYQVQATIQNPNYNDVFRAGLKRVTYYDEGAPICDGVPEVFQTIASGQAFFGATMTGMFALSPGYNYIVVTLYVNNEKKATAIKRVYYEAANTGVKITSPVNNYITGKAIITVEGESTYEKVLINNIPVNTKKTAAGTYTFVQDRQKLKEGFNKLVARTFNPQAPEIVYTDSIVLYYQRDESVFDFLDPLQDAVCKTGTVGIRGVIDTIDTDLVRVRMRAYFKPFGVGDDFYYAFRDTDSADSQVVLRDLENEENFLLSHYAFASEFDLGLSMDTDRVCLPSMPLKKIKPERIQR